MLRKNIGRCFLLIVVQLLMVLFFSTYAFADSWESEIKLTYDQTDSNTAGVLDTTKSVTEKYTLTYQSPILLLYKSSGEMKFKLPISRTEGTDEADSYTIDPSLDIDFKGDPYSLKILYKKSFSYTESIDDTPSEQKTTDDYSFTLRLTPHKSFPESEIKLTQKTDYEADVINTKTATKDLDLKYEYKDFKSKISYAYEKTDDMLLGGNDSQNETINGEMSFKKDLTKDTKLSLKYKGEESDAKTFSDSAISTSKSSTQSAEGKLDGKFKLTYSTDFKGSYKYNFNRDRLEDIDEIDQEIKTELSQKIYKWTKLTIKYDRERTETKDIEHELAVTETYNYKLESKRKFKWWLDLSAKYEREDERAEGRSIADSAEGTWKTKHQKGLETECTASYDEQDADGVVDKTTTYKAKVKWPFLIGEDLKIEPEYNYEDGNSEDDDGVSSESIIRESKIKFTYDKSIANDKIKIKLDHTYGLKIDEQIGTDDDGIVRERNDDSKFELTLQDFLPDMKVVGSVTRKATDQDDDDEPMEVTNTYSLDLDWDVEILLATISLGYKRDAENSEGEEDSESGSQTFDLKVKWSYEIYEVTCTYKFDETFDDEIDENQSVNLSLGIKF